MAKSKNQLKERKQNWQEVYAKVDSILSPRDHPFDYEGIYSQAYALYRQGFRYWFSQTEMEELAKYNRQFETPMMERELVDLYFRKPVGVEGGIFMSVGNAMQILGSNRSQVLSAVHVGRAFSDLGFKRVKVKDQRGYVVVQRTGAEIEVYRRQMAEDAECDVGQ